MDREQKNFKNRKRKKVCAFCADKIEHIDYKDANRLRKFISERFKKSHLYSFQAENTQNQSFLWDYDTNGD